MFTAVFTLVFNVLGLIYSFGLFCPAPPDDDSKNDLFISWWRTKLPFLPSDRLHLPQSKTEIDCINKCSFNWKKFIKGSKKKISFFFLLAFCALCHECKLVLIIGIFRSMSWWFQTVNSRVCSVFTASASVLFIHGCDTWPLPLTAFPSVLVSQTAYQDDVLTTLLYDPPPRRYPSAFSMGCTKRSCFSVMTSRRITCYSCCARPLRSRRGTWWRLFCQVRRLLWSEVKRKISLCLPLSTNINGYG